MVEARPKVALTEAPEITIGDINDITGTIADKDRYLLNTGGTRINPATEDTLSDVKSNTSNLSKLDVNLSTRASESTLSTINSKITKADTDNVKIIQSVTSTINNNQVTVGTTAVALTTSSTPLKFGIVVRADPNNTGNVYVGNSSVTTSTGYLLEPGGGISLEIDDASKVYVIADTDNQKVYWLGV